MKTDNVSMSFSSLLSYYQESQFNPVPIPLNTAEAWQNHCAKRRNLYERHLSIPLELIRDRSVLEVGCNSGENALVLASLGARLTLVEPNEQVLGLLRSTFNRFGLDQQIAKLVHSDILSFHPDQQFDLVVAEGFLYTLPDRDTMLQKVASFAKPGGLGVISFNDVSGCFLEMLKRAVLRCTCHLRHVADWNSDAGLSIAHDLFMEDFQRLNASRTFHAWWKDTLVNPFVSYQYLWDYQRIVPLLNAVGCHFWASSPKWVLTDAFSWYKSFAPSGAQDREVLLHWPSELIYFVLGSPRSELPSETASPQLVDEVYRVTKALSDLSLEEEPNFEQLTDPRSLFDLLEHNRTQRIRTISVQLRRLFEALKGQSADSLREVYLSSPELRAAWGTPYHYLAFQKGVESEPLAPSRAGEEIDLTILIPCFNEEKYIERTLDNVFAAVTESRCTYEIIVVDDKSTDDTYGVAERWRDRHPDVSVFLRRNSINRGLSRTFVDGAFLGRGRFYRLVCGDDAEPKETLSKVFKRIGEADMIIPYYPLVPGKSAFRMALSRSYTWLVNQISGYRLNYYNGLAVHRRYNVMRWGPYSFGFGFQAELVTRLLDEGATYIELPVEAVHKEKDARASAVNWRNFLSVAHSLLEIFIRRIRRKTFGQ